MNCIIPGLFLGNRESTLTAEKKGIDVILSIGVKSLSKDIENVYICLSDDSSLNIKNELDDITFKMFNYLSSNRTLLIHCKEGINRSPSFVLAYLCRYEDFTFLEAIDHILNKRQICNFSFRDNVRQWLLNINPQYVFTEKELENNNVKQMIEKNKIKKENDNLVNKWFTYLSNDKNYETEEIFKYPIDFNNIIEVFIWTDYPMIRYILDTNEVVYRKEVLQKGIKSQMFVREWLKDKCVCNFIRDTSDLGNQFVKGFNGFGMIVKKKILQDDCSVDCSVDCSEDYADTFTFEDYE